MGRQQQILYYVQKSAGVMLACLLSMVITVMCKVAAGVKDADRRLGSASEQAPQALLAYVYIYMFFFFPHSITLCQKLELVLC